MTWARTPAERSAAVDWALVALVLRVSAPSLSTTMLRSPVSPSAVTARDTAS